MLRRSGYQVVRITAAQDRAVLKIRVSNIRALAAEPLSCSQPQPAAVPEPEQA